MAFTSSSGNLVLTFGWHKTPADKRSAKLISLIFPCYSLLFPVQISCITTTLALFGHSPKLEKKLS